MSQQLISDLPDWVPAEAWAEFVKMRKAKKAPLTEYAAKLILKKLAALARDGNDPQEVLDQSIVNCWQGVFALRPDQITRAPAQTQADRARSWANGITGRFDAHEIPDSRVVEMVAAPLRRLK